MKILQLLCFPLYGSGSGTYVRKISEALMKRGHQVAIVCPDARELKNIKIYEVKLPFMAVFTGHPEYSDARLYSQLSGARLNDVQTAFMDKIIYAVEEFRPDVIHVHHASNLAWVANYIKAVYQIHYIVTSHNTDVINAVLDKRYIPLTQDALNRADIITAVSNNTRDHLLKIIGRGHPQFAEKMKILPCGVDTKMFPNSGSVLGVERKYKLERKKVVLYSGKVTAIKGVDFFIKAADKFPDSKFVIMGDGEELDKMKALAQKNQHRNTVFTGYLGSGDKNIISQLYRRAEVVAVPSTLSEGIPLSLLEAMSSGAAVVASDIGGIPTAIRHMKNGLLIKPKSVSSLVGGIKIVLSDVKLKEKLAKVAREDAVAKFDWSIIATRAERYYQICFDRSKKNRASKKPSFVTDEEYLEDKRLVEQIQQEKGV